VSSVGRNSFFKLIYSDLIEV